MLDDAIRVDDVDLIWLLEYDSQTPENHVNRDRIQVSTAYNKSFNAEITFNPRLINKNPLTEAYLVYTKMDLTQNRDQAKLVLHSAQTLIPHTCHTSVLNFFFLSFPFLFLFRFRLQFGLHIAPVNQTHC